MIVKKKKIKLGVNTQWVYGIHQIKSFIPQNITKISLYMEHYKMKDDIHFYTENISHMNSIIIYLLGNEGQVIDLTCNNSGYPVIITFYYRNTYIEYILGYPHKKQIIYKFNNIKFERNVDKNYNQSFIINDKEYIKIKDPFTLSIISFIQETEILNYDNIIKNVELTDIILNNSHIKNIK